ncbi:SHOCT domain-containing protein [Staphylococcus simulans]|uniref:SHOCT domain-containing protein n=1 Tax=Staphylococcus simulans TaxID=1286 RepID=UPI003CE9B35D
MISDKNKKIFLESEYSGLEVSYMNDALFSINSGKLYNGAIFLTPNSMIFLSKNYKKEIILGALKIESEKRGLIYHKVYLIDSLDDTGVNIEFTTKSEKDKFIENFELVNQIILDIYYGNKNKEEEIEVETEKKKKNETLPYEELKKLKELLDMGILTQDEFDRKKSQLLEDYL